MCGNTCWSWTWINLNSPSKREGLGSPLAACSMYGDLTCSLHSVNNFHCFVIIKRMYVFVFEDHMLDWHSCQICYPLEIKLLILLLHAPALYFWEVFTNVSRFKIRLGTKVIIHARPSLKSDTAGAWSRLKWSRITFYLLIILSRDKEVKVCLFSIMLKRSGYLEALYFKQSWDV